MGELNERVDEPKDEVNSLRNDLEDFEDAVDATTERLEEELARANRARLSIWPQSSNGKSTCASNGCFAQGTEAGVRTDSV